MLYATAFIRALIASVGVISVDYSGDWHELYRQNGRVFGEKPKELVVHALNLWQPASTRPRALDIGSYTGRNALYLARQGFSVWAMDPSLPALEDLQQQAEAEGLDCNVREGLIENYTWRYTYDAVLFCGVSHSMHDPDVEHTLAKMREHTVPGGINIVSAFTEMVKPHQRSFMAPQRIKKLYLEWEILAFEVRVTSLKLPTRERSTVTVAELIARRPAEAWTGQ